MGSGNRQLGLLRYYSFVIMVTIRLLQSSLCDRDCADVFIRWADHLASPTVNQRVKALLVLLSIGHFQRVIETLHNMRYITHAALFSEACLQYGILQTNQSQTSILCLYCQLPWLLYLNYDVSCVTGDSVWGLCPIFTLHWFLQSNASLLFPGWSYWQ